MCWVRFEGDFCLLHQTPLSPKPCASLDLGACCSSLKRRIVDGVSGLSGLHLGQNITLRAFHIHALPLLHPVILIENSPSAAPNFGTHWTATETAAYHPDPACLRPRALNMPQGTNQKVQTAQTRAPDVNPRVQIALRWQDFSASMA